MDDNTDIDLAISRVRLAIAESDIRAAKAASKSRTNYANRSAQNKTYKPNGVVASNFTYSGPNARSVGTPFGQVKSTKSNFTYTAPRASKPTKSINKFGFKKNSIADKVGKSFRKAYLGK